MSPEQGMRFLTVAMIQSGGSLLLAFMLAGALGVPGHADEPFPAARMQPFSFTNQSPPALALLPFSATSAAVYILHPGFLCPSGMEYPYLK
jgi:hypothetical protein